MKNSILFVALFFVANFTFAGDINNSKDKESTKLVSGKVIDKNSGEEIAGASIKINDKIIYSDLNGNFSAIIPSSKAEAVVTSISYIDTKVNIDPFSFITIVVELESK
jgi:hypothetical protein